jgi:long-chain acyl-CoA synthetase
MKTTMDYSALNSLPEMFFEQSRRFEDAALLWAKRNDRWQSMSWREVRELVEAVAAGLRTLGVKKGDRVALVAENRPEWLIADIGIMAAGAITVPAYTTNTADDHAHVLSDSGARLAIVSTAALARTVLPAAERTGSTRTIVTLEPILPAPMTGIDILTWGKLLDQGRNARGSCRTSANPSARNDTACIIYTSGTSGKPKGVMLSHGAILCNCMGAHEFLKELPDFGRERESFLSFLPLSHSYEHTAGQFLPIAIGAELYYAEGVEKLVPNLAEVRPSIMTAVPRLYEAMHARIQRGVAHANGLQRWLFDKTLSLGRKRYESPATLSLSEKALNALLDRVVREKVRQRFGGRLKAFVSGGAPLNYDIGLFFTALGLRIMQGYGQTEAAPVISCNRYDKNKLHTVGPPLNGAEVRIAEEGEILVRGELVMQGYWNNPRATAETIQDGWLHTGDIGVIDVDGYIQITDRKKDIIVNSGGDNLSPARVEGMLTAEPELAQAMVYGDRRPHLVALVVPDPEFVKEWARANGKSPSVAVLANDDTFNKALHDVIERVNRNLSVIERIRHLIVAPEPFTIENEMMTPTMKLRRHVIIDVYGEALERLYVH